MATDIILTSSPDGPIIAQDHVTGAILAQFSITRSPRKGLAFTSGGLIAASHITLSASGFIHLFNWWSCSVLRSVPVPEPVAPLVATPNGSFLLAGGLSGRVYVLSLPSCDLFRAFHAHQRTVSCLAINSDGSLVISGSDDGTIAVFPIISLLDISSTESSDGDSVQTLYKFIAHSMSITGIASGTGGCNSIFISCSLDCMIKFWSLANGACLRTVHLQCALWSVMLDSTDAEAYAGGSDGRVYAVAMKKRRRRRLSGEEDGVAAWSAEESNGGAVIALAMVNGDRNLVSASEDGTTTIWEAGQVVRVLRHGQNVGVSDLLVARGVSRTSRGVRRDEGDGSFNGSSSICMEGMYKEVKEVEEMEQWLGVAVKDRRRAIDVLQTAINTYQRLLGILLKEANGGQ